MSGYFRFAYGVVELGDGLGVVPVAVGLFGVAEILATAGQATPPEVIKPRLRELLPSRQEWRESAAPIGRGTVLGFLIGILPGLGPHHLELRLLRGREAAVAASRASSATAPSPAWRGRSRRTTRRPRGRWCRCWRSACRRARSPP